MSDHDDQEDNGQEKQIVALKYDQKSAPKVIAKAHGTLAEELLEIAKENDVMIHQDKELSQFLQRLDMGQEIPKELYLVIAELIAFAFVLQGKFPDNWKNIHNRVDIKS